MRPMDMLCNALDAAPGRASMSRETLVSRPGHPMADENGMVPKHLAPPKCHAVDAHVYVISDTMAPVLNMATGRMHDSKSRFRADTRSAGCIEVGNDPAALRTRGLPEPTMHEVAGDVKRSIEELRSGRPAPPIRRGYDGSFS